MAIETNELIDVQTLSPFKKFIMTIGNLPTSYLESMSYGEMLMWFCNYLQETVIPTVNNNGLAVEELQGLYVELKNYVDTYFDNLDVQEEINNKLDNLVENGTLTRLIGNYIDPLIASQNQNIETFKNDTTSTLNAMQNQINSVASGTPLVASSTSNMTDTTKVYVNTTDGYWYYYDGDSWEQGGVYQSTGIDDNSIGFNKISENLFNYIGDSADLNKLKTHSQLLYINDNDNGLVNHKLYLNQLTKIEDKYWNGTAVVDTNNQDLYEYIVQNGDIAIYVNIATAQSNLGYAVYLDNEVETNIALPNGIQNSAYFISTSQGQKYTKIYLNQTKTPTINYIEITRGCGNESNYNIINTVDKAVQLKSYVLGANGNIAHNDGYYYAKVKYDPNKTYYVKQITSQPLNQPGACYDTNNNLLGAITKTTYKTTDTDTIYKLSIINGTDYFYSNLKLESVLYYENKKEDIVKTYTKTILNKPYTIENNTAIFFGDSFVRGSGATDDDHRWTNIFSLKNNLTSRNMGVSGVTFTKDLRVGYGNIVDIIKDTMITENLIFIAGGINDYLAQGTIGNIDSSNNQNLYGALNELASYLKTNYSNKKIIFILPIYTPLTSYNGVSLVTNIQYYREAIYNVCARNGFDVVDGYDLGFPTYVGDALSSYLLADNLHPNDRGHELYATTLSSILH